MRVRDVSESWGESGSSAPGPEDAPFLPRILLCLRRRALLILLVWGAIVAGAGLLVSLRPKQYRAEAMLEVRPEQPLIADPADPATAGSIQLWDSYFRTQVSLLQSRKLLERSLQSVSAPVARDYAALEDPAQALAAQLEVETIPSSFILRVALNHPSPDRGPELVNALVTNYVEEATGRWRELKTDAAQLLDKETLPSIEHKMQQADKNLQRFQEETGFADFDQQYASLAEAGRKLTSQLLEARLKRVKFQSEREALAENGDSLAGFFDPAMPSMRVLEPLLAQRSTLEQQLSSERLVFKEKHPRVLALERQLAQVRDQIRGVFKAAAQAIDRELLAIVIEEQILLQEQAKIEKAMADSRVERTRYRTLETEATAARDVYNAYVKKADDTKATSKGGLASVRVIDFARSPAHAGDKGRLILTVAAVIGLLLGLASALVAEELDDRITTPRDVEVFLGISILGLIPRLSRGLRAPARAPLVLTDDPSSLNFEVLRMLRGEVTARLERIRRGRVIAVAGPRYGEGKSTIALNLARVLAMEDRRVLLIDGDLRRPQLKALLARRKGMGLEEYLRGERDLQGCVQPSRLPLVDVIGAEQPLDRPGEVAGSDRFQELLHEARAIYEYVIIDAGSANLISEVSAYGRQADGTLLVLEYGETRRRAVRLAKRRLEGSRILGAVLNGIPAKATDLRLQDPELPPDVREELSSDGDLVAIVEQELLSPGNLPRRSSDRSSGA